jgi:hypothetical protein
MSSPAAQSFPPSSRSAVRCYHCLDQFSWDERTVHDVKTGNAIELDKISDPVKRDEVMLNAYVRCPNPSSDYPEKHYLPLGYVRYLPPLVVGLVGTSDAGKSTLFATMADEIDRGHLRRYGITARPVMRELHTKFQHDIIRPLLKEGTALAHTRPAERGVEFADAYLLTSGSKVRPIAFFDVGGESLALGGPDTRFVQTLSALIFVVDPNRALGRAEGARDQAGRTSSEGDRAFEAVLDRLGGAAHYREVSAAIVLAQADTLRFEPTVRRWLSSDDEDRAVDAGSIREESRDVYAYLYQHEATAWLRPFESFQKCTLHVVSATGGNPTAEVYRRGLRPRRVLEPLVAVLSMAGIIDGPEASLVGR